jgi:hypothetical protein
VDPVNLTRVETLTPETCGSEKPHRIVVAVRDPKNLAHLRKVLEEIDPEDTDVVVMSSKVSKSYQLEGDVAKPTEEEEVLFTQIIATAEKAGHGVIPLLVPSNDPYHAMAQAAHDLNARELVVGKSAKTLPEIQMEQIALAWGSIRRPEGQRLQIRILWDGAEFKEEIA